MEWLKNLNSAIEYIENNLDNEISAETAAQIACCSVYYFQRMFTSFTGISLSEYIRRRRMSQAAFELQRTDKKVLDIALKYGYSSPTSFNRAFQNVHGITPAAAKNAGSILNAYPPITFSVKVAGGTALPYYITEKPAMRIVGIRTPLVTDMEENQKTIPSFWNTAWKENLIPRIISLSDGKPGGILGVSVWRNPQEIFYCIGVSSAEAVPAGMCECEIPASAWVVFENDGRFKENVQNVFRRFYTEWLLFSGYEYAGLPDIEMYPEAAGKPGIGHSEVWIAIRKEKETRLHGI